MKTFYLAIIALAFNGLINGELSQPGCGLRPLEDPARVISGTEATPGDWAWSVSLTMNGRHFCGGVLIDDTTVVSAAHCFSGSSYINPALRVDIGVHDRNNKEDWVQTRTVSKLYIHQSFSMQNLRYDIALIKLSSKITLNDTYVIPICIDESNSTISELEPQGKTGWLTGWGHEKYQGVLTRYKMQGSIDILTDNRCKQRYGYLYNTDVQICAGENGVDAGACQGDSGGPFVLPYQGRWYLVGLVSWGYGCGDGTVFARFNYFLSWIKDRINL
ncbi:chymotrypsin-like protease CTRL-1 [Brachionus plicatilis]|uniref:Chymotrypsin-like protease CTRL-1 n=1 Tax=Brachionus plicatilis TaxID=10195 RepID=A0A3M7P690_BRAPC|nr:chymotrypsin-like protease CTRL-1 [Brachionus plicatilis]